MKKLTKKIRGPVLEPANPGAPTESFLKDEEPPETLFAPEAGPKDLKLSFQKVIVILAAYSQTYKKLTAAQFKQGKVTKLGNVAAVGLEMIPGKPYEVEITNEIQALIKGGVFQIIRNTVYGGTRK